MKYLAWLLLSVHFITHILHEHSLNCHFSLPWQGNKYRLCLLIYPDMFTLSEYTHLCPCWYSIVSLKFIERCYCCLKGVSISAWVTKLVHSHVDIENFDFFLWGPEIFKEKLPK